MAAVITIRQGQVYTLIESHLHRSAHQRFDRFFIVIDRIFYILDLTAVGKLPETVFQILLLDRGDILANVAVETIAHILSVGNIFNDSIFLSELLYLQTAKVLCRCRIDRIQISIRLLKLIDSVVDVLQYFQSKLTVFYKGFSIVELLQLVECSDTERRSCCLKKRLDLIMQTKVSAIETAFSERQRVCGCTKLAKVRIRTNVDLTDQL